MTDPGSAPPSYQEVTASQIHIEEAPPPSYHEYLEGSRPRSYREFRIEYRSGETHENYGLSIEDNVIREIDLESTAADAGLLPGGRILIINGIDYRRKSPEDALNYIKTLYDQFSALTLVLEYILSDEDLGDFGKYVDPLTLENSQCKAFTVQYKPGRFDAYYGILLRGDIIKSVCPGTVGSLAGVTPGGRVLKLNGVDIRGKSEEQINQIFTAQYENGAKLDIIVDYTTINSSQHLHSGTNRDARFAPMTGSSAHLTEHVLSNGLGLLGMGITGNKITDVLPGSRAHIAGMRTGGAILKVNGIPVHGDIIERIVAVQGSGQICRILVQYPSLTGSTEGSSTYHTEHLIPSGPGLIGMGVTGYEITDVLAGSRAHDAGVRTGGTILKVNGIPVHELDVDIIQSIAAIQRNHQTCRILVQYPSLQGTQAGRSVATATTPIRTPLISQPTGSSRINYTSRPEWESTTPRNRYREMAGHNTPQLDYSHMMGGNEIVCLTCWSVISMLLFCLGIPGLVFSLLASGATDKGRIHKFRVLAYVSNILADLVGVVLIVIIVFKLKEYKAVNGPLPP